MSSLKHARFYAAHMCTLMFIILVVFAVLFVPALSSAQDYPVSVVETGKTPGFKPPVLYLNQCIAAHRLLPKLRHNRTLHEPFLINQDKDLGEIGASINYGFMVKMIFSQVKAFNLLADPYDDPERPAPGYSWQLKIFHPGSSPGKLPPEERPILLYYSASAPAAPSPSAIMLWTGLGTTMPSGATLSPSRFSSEMTQA